MESIEKLREKIQLDVNNPWCDLKGDLLAMCDKVEAEIAERYMELPTDADGVPIKAFDEIEQGRVAVVANDSGGQYAFIYRGFEKGCYLFEWVKADTCHHVKPRTLEDVLEDFSIACDEQYHIRPRIELIAEYANEIRDILGLSE